MLFQCRSLNNEALLNKQTEEKPVNLFIKQAHCSKGILLLNPPPLRTNIYLRLQIKHITTSQQKYVSQWDLSRVQLNKSLEISRASLQREHISTGKHPTGNYSHKRSSKNIHDKRREKRQEARQGHTSETQVGSITTKCMEAPRKKHCVHLGSLCMNPLCPDKQLGP